MKDIILSYIILSATEFCKFGNSQQRVETRLAVTEVNFCLMSTSPNSSTSKKSGYRKYKRSYHVAPFLAGNNIFSHGLCWLSDCSWRV